MISFSKFDCILWDFDGVLMDSMPIREQGFKEVLSAYPANEVELLVSYHRQNGGLSRYVKFRYFFEQIRGETVTEQQVLNLAEEFSCIMRGLLMNPALLIQDTVEFVKNHYTKFVMHIISGSDGAELRDICKAVGIDMYFTSILGSPTPKTVLVAGILKSVPYKNVVMIGDSINDLQAAQSNGIEFIGYNNTSLRDVCSNYVDLFSTSNASLSK